MRVIKKIKSAKNTEGLVGIGVEFASSIGFNLFLYAGIGQVPIASPKVTILGNYSAEWMSRYQEKGYARIDPVMLHLADAITPFCWSELEMRGPEAEDFMLDACRHGVCSGMSIPLFAGCGYSAVMSIASSCIEKDACDVLRRKKGEILLFATSFHEAVIKMTAPNEKVQLSLLEKQCLMWAAEGKTTWEIGQILSIKERAVIYHLDNAANKIGAINRQQAIARAIATGELRSSVVAVPDVITFS